MNEKHHFNQTEAHHLFVKDQLLPDAAAPIAVHYQYIYPGRAVRAICLR